MRVLAGSDFVSNKTKTEDNYGDLTTIMLFAGITCVSNCMHKGLELISCILHVVTPVT